MIATFVRWVGMAGGWAFWVWLVVGTRREARRRAAMHAISSSRGTAQSAGPVLGLCSKCQAPKLPPGVKVPDYLRVCQCPPPSAAEAMDAMRPPRPTS